MALLWSKQVGDVHYEVRNAGRSLRLYTDGVFHSQYNPNRPLAGSVWDLLALPAFLQPPRRVLLLGVGGGAVARQLLHFFQPTALVGVELDRQHIEVAKRFFELDRPPVELHHADADAWLGDYRGPPFDLIIDDLFGGRDGDPRRALPADAPWLRRLTHHLTADGTLVINFICAHELHDSGWFHDPQLRRRLPGALQLELPRYENAVGALFAHPTPPTRLRAALRRHGIRLDRRTNPLDYHITPLA